MYSLFVIPTVAKFYTGEEKYLTGILFLDQKDIDELIKEKKWYKDNFNEVLLEKMEVVVKQYILKLKKITILDASFLIKGGYTDRKFFGMWDNPERYYSNERNRPKYNLVTEIVKIMQQVLNTNEISVADFIKEVGKKSEARNAIISAEFVDDEGLKIQFYSIKKEVRLGSDVQT